MRADPYKLMHGAKRAHHGVFLNRHMSAQGRAVYQHGVIADHAVVANVGVSHDQYMAANLRQPSALCRPAIDRDTLANFVVIANLEPSRLPSVRYVLGGHPDGAKREEAVVRSDLRRTLDRHMRHQVASLTQ